MTNGKMSRFFPVLYLGMFLGVLALYLPVLDHGFIAYDDGINLVQNPHIRQADGLWFFAHFYDGNWIPLNWLSHIAVFQWLGDQAGLHAFVNVIFHSLNGLLLAFLLQTITQARWRSIAVALLFLIHPLHVESVAWISERKDVLCAFFFFLSLHSYVLYVRAKNRWAYLGSWLLFAAALMSKPMAVTLPFVLLYLDEWPLKRFRGQELRSLLLEKIPFFILSLIAAVLVSRAHRELGWLNSSEEISQLARILNAGLSYVLYLIKILMPYSLSVFYPYLSLRELVAQGTVSGLFLLILSAVFYRLSFQSRFWRIGWFWYLITLLPVIGLISFAGFSMADRFTYLPSIGIFILLVWGSWDLWIKRSWSPRVLAAIFLIYTAGLTVLSWNQIHVWKNTETLFTHALRVTPRNWVAHIQLGDEYARQKDWNRAAGHYQKALEIRMDASVLNNFGNVLYEGGRPDEAEKLYQAAAQLNPKLPESWKNLAMTAEARGDWKASGGFYIRLMELQPKKEDAYRGLIRSLEHQQRNQEADYLAKKARSIFPNSSVFLREGSDHSEP